MINEIFRDIKKSTKKALLNKISIGLLGLEFKSENIIKLKAMKFIVKKLFLLISNNGNVLCQWQEKYCKRNFTC